MGLKTPRHKLTASYKAGQLAGWVKRINKAPKWICSAAIAPTPDAADDYYQQHFAALWEEPVDSRLAAHQDPATLPISTLCNVFLDRKKQRIGLAVRGIQQESYDEYEDVMLDFSGHRPASSGTIGQTRFCDLTSDDFGSYHADLGKRFGIDRQSKYVVIVRSLFKFLSKPPARLPMPDYGEQFHLPSRADRRRDRKRSKEEHGPKLFTPEDIVEQLNGRPLTDKELKAQQKRRLASHRGLIAKVPTRIKGAGGTLRAMILLALNAGFGNTDLSDLPLSVIRRALADGWIDYARGKTGADRLAWLWPETIEAVKKYLATRPDHSDERFADLLFLTRFGLPYVRGSKDQIGMQYGVLLKRLGQTRTGRNFYSLRRTYRSIAAEVGKELVIDLSMGHAEEADDMARVYTVADLRDELKRVSLHVRDRFFKALSYKSGRRSSSKRVQGSSAASAKSSKAQAVKGRRENSRG